MKLVIKEIDQQVLEGTITFVYEEDLSLNEKFKTLKDRKAFEAKIGQVIYCMNDAMKATILVGLGEKDVFKREKFVEAVAKGVKEAKKLKLTTYGIIFSDREKMCQEQIIKALAEGVGLAGYTFDSYKTDAKPYEAEVVLLGLEESEKEQVAKQLEAANHIVEGIIEARNLVNEPANKMYPETLADRVVEVGKESGFEVEVYDEVWIQEVGMKAFYEVAKGSDRKPRFIVMRYMGAPESEEKMGLVGKGLTFDTGGYSLKPTASMETMKSDMGGAAAVVGAMKALAMNKVKKNVVAVIAACENAISGGSYKPGDIIGSMAGKTIEVLNTDAEGRLTLVDAITYIIEKEAVDKVVDVATLTGAVLVALGTEITGVVSNNDAFYDELVVASEKVGEKFWRLPNDESYKELIKGSFADLKNTGGRHAGTITAGMFIEAFVQDKPWLHLDIAGTSWTDSNKPECPKGGTGAPVKTLYELVVGA